MKTASILVKKNNYKSGRDKALLEIGDKLITYYVAKKTSKVVDKVILGAKNEVQAEKILSNVPYIDDLAYAPINDYSLLKGMFSTLNNASEGHNLLIRCDMALVKEEVIEYLFESIGTYDAVIPRYPNGGLEYLLSVYRVGKTREAIKRVLEEDKRDIQSVLNKLDVKYVPVENLRELDKNLSSLEKINCKEKLEKFSSTLKTT